MIKFSELSLFDQTATIALYFTLFVAAVICITALLVKKRRPEMMKSFSSTAVGIVIGYCLGIIGVLLIFKLLDNIAKDYIDLKTFIPVVVTLGLSLILAIAGFAISIFKPKKLKLFSKIASITVAAALLTVLIMTMIDTYKSEVANISGEVQLYVYTAAIVVLIIVLAFTVGKKVECDQTKALVFAAISIAMSFALSYLRFFEMPKGGSVTFASLVPLMIYSYMFGIRRGVLAGFIYGFLQFVQAPWFYHPIQFLLDYPIAFSAIGLAGIFKETNVFKNNRNSRVLQFALGAVAAVIIRYFSHVISGIFVFGSGDPENYGAVAWSFMYNAAYVFVDLAIALVAGIALVQSKSFYSFMMDRVTTEK